MSNLTSAIYLGCERAGGQLRGSIPFPDSIEFVYEVDEQLFRHSINIVGMAAEQVEHAAHEIVTARRLLMATPPCHS